MFWLVAGAGAHAQQSTGDVPTNWWFDRTGNGQGRLFEAIFRACPKQGFLSNKKCVRAKIVESFAKLNDAGKHCDEEDPDQLFRCVASFTSAQRIYRTMGVDPQTTMDWDDPFGSMTDVQQAIAARLTAKCPDMAQTDCIAQELSVLTALPPEDARFCVRTTDVTDAARCGEALVRLDTYMIARKSLE
jgi:hypothetical protein